MSLEDVLNSSVSLPHPLPAKLPDGSPVVLRDVGTLANFLLATGAMARGSHPALWEKAEAAIVDADEHPSDNEKVREAWLAAYDLLSTAKLLQES